MTDGEIVLIEEEALQKRITELAETIQRDYQQKELVIIGVLTGAYMFTADFTRALWKNGYTQFVVDFVGVASYGNEKSSSRKPVFTKQVSVPLEDKDVLLVEDIIETGFSLASLRQALLVRKPASLKTLVLLAKEGKLETDLVPDYTGFSVAHNQWVEGYGLDTSQYGRGRPEIIERTSE